MRIIFVHHSCFVVEVDDKVLIFDWFQGDRVPGYTFRGVLPAYEKETPIYVFASHKHQDHFTMDVLHLEEQYRNIHFILSKDCKMSPNFLKKHGFSSGIGDKILYVGSNATYHVEDLTIETFRSTDVGVAFYVETGGASFYHAGDLNNWKWDGVGELINGQMELAYKSQIRKLTGRRINIAFVPMDPRQKDYQTLGIDYFLRHTDAEYVFPMHMWQDYSQIPIYRKSISNAAMAERIVEITHENQVFEIQER